MYFCLTAVKLEAEGQRCSIGAGSSLVGRQEKAVDCARRCRSTKSYADMEVFVFGKSFAVDNYGKRYCGCYPTNVKRTCAKKSDSTLDLYKVVV